MNTLPDIDQEMIAQLKEAVGDDIFARLRDKCIANSTERLDAMGAAMANGDFDQIRACAHALAGLFSQFGLVAVEQAARAVEAAEEPLLSAAVASLVETARTGLRRLRELN